MITEEEIRKLSIKSQTIPQNIGREYFQHLFLRSFYQQADSEKILFKGGTALRLVFDSPRFSEDLDFSGFKTNQREIENLLETTILAISLEEKIELKEAKTTTGGYLSRFEGQIAGLKIGLGLDISLRNGRKMIGEVKTVPNTYLPEYTIITLPEEILFEEKIQAVLTRGKPRDFFDLYFLLRRGFGKIVKIDNRKEILKKIEDIDNRLITSELKTFLPKSHHLLLPSFKKNLKQELEKFK
jgi:predicted nucleotidyltransferase component of viral defense system